MIVYKIRRREDGLFSMGGSHYMSISWTKNGKIWKQKGHLHSHLSQLMGAAHAYEGCELVSFELTETEIDTMSIKLYLEQRREEKVRQQNAQAVRYAGQQEQKRREQYHELRDEFGHEDGHQIR